MNGTSKNDHPHSPVTPYWRRIIFNIRKCTMYNVHVHHQVCTKLTNPSLEQAPHSPLLGHPTNAFRSPSHLNLKCPLKPHVAAPAYATQTNVIQFPFTFSSFPLLHYWIGLFKSISSKFEAKRTNSFSPLLCSKSPYIARSTVHSAMST